MEVYSPFVIDSQGYPRGTAEWTVERIHWRQGAMERSGASARGPVKWLPTPGMYCKSIPGSDPCVFEKWRCLAPWEALVRTISEGLQIGESTDFHRGEVAMEVSDTSARDPVTWLPAPGMYCKSIAESDPLWG